MYENLFDMVADIQAHAKRGEVITPADDVTRLVIGFVSPLHRWEITLFNVKNTDTSDFTTKQIETFKKFRTLRGRKELCSNF